MSEERARQAEGVLRGEGHGSEGHHRQMQSPGFSWASARRRSWPWSWAWSTGLYSSSRFGNPSGL